MTKFTKSQLIELIQESIAETEQEILAEQGSPISGMGMGSSGGRTAAPRARPSRRFDAAEAEAFAKKYNNDLNKIAMLQNDPEFFNTPANLNAWANFNDYANVNLPDDWKAKWRKAREYADKAARAEINGPSVAQKVAGKIKSMFGKTPSPQTVAEIAKIADEVIAENKAITARIVKRLEESAKR